MAPLSLQSAADLGSFRLECKNSKVVLFHAGIWYGLQIICILLKDVINLAEKKEVLK